MESRIGTWKKCSSILFSESVGLLQNPYPDSQYQNQRRNAFLDGYKRWDCACAGTPSLGKRRSGQQRNVRMKNTFSFFYGRGGAGLIRGVQMAEYLGAKKNPTKGFKNDICTYVKIRPPDNHSKRSYLDLVCRLLLEKKHDDVRVAEQGFRAR